MPQNYFMYNLQLNFMLSWNPTAIELDYVTWYVLNWIHHICSLGQPLTVTTVTSFSHWGLTADFWLPFM